MHEPLDVHHCAPDHNRHSSPRQDVIDGLLGAVNEITWQNNINRMLFSHELIAIPSWGFRWGKLAMKGEQRPLRHWGVIQNWRPSYNARSQSYGTGAWYSYPQPVVPLGAHAAPRQMVGNTKIYQPLFWSKSRGSQEVITLRTAVPFWGQSTWKFEWLVPKTGLQP